jgi:hypothetical protein
VNAWGARERSQEFYDVEKPSEIDNGFIKVTNVAADEKIVNIFTGKGVTATTVPSVKISTIEFTPKDITSLKPNEVFVFGSNNRGVHGLGAAKTAVDKFGAIQNQASGQQGKSFAIRTKMYQNNVLTKYNELTEENKKLMDKMTIEDLNTLRLAAVSNPNNKYYVTEIGTKLAGRTVDQMKGLFLSMNSKFGIPSNIILPEVFEIRNQVANKNKPGDLPAIDRTPKSCQ